MERPREYSHQLLSLHRNIIFLLAWCAMSTLDRPLRNAQLVGAAYERSFPMHTQQRCEANCRSGSHECQKRQTSTGPLVKAKLSDFLHSRLQMTRLASEMSLEEGELDKQAGPNSLGMQIL
jgi:hypothetical protein